MMKTSTDKLKLTRYTSLLLATCWVQGWFLFSMLHVLYYGSMSTFSLVRSVIGVFVASIIFLIVAKRMKDISMALDKNADEEIKSIWQELTSPINEELNVLDQVVKKIVALDPKHPFKKLTIEIEQAANKDNRLLVLSKFEPQYPEPVIQNEEFSNG